MMRRDGPPAHTLSIKTILMVVVVMAMPLAMVSVSEEAGASSTVRALEITEDKANPTVSWKKFDGNPVKVYDFNNDGKKEIIAQNDNQWVYVFDSETGKMLAEVTTAFPSGWGARSFNGPEVAILEHGKDVRLVVANSAAVITSFRFDPGASTSTHIVLHKEWDRRLNDCFGGAGMDAKPVFADLNQDGDLEILGATEEFGVYALHPNGDLFWKNCLGGGNASPSIADLNQDGFPDVVHVSDSGVVAALDGRNGGWLWGFNAKSHFNLGSASIPVSAGIGNLDFSGGPDIVVGLRDSHDTQNYDNNHAMLLALNSWGNILWAKQDPNANPLTYTRPVIVDADENGVNEVYWGDWNTIGHKGGIPQEDSWQTTGPANFYRFDHQGNKVWRQSLNTYWSNKDVPIADVDGDGVQEMLANGPGHNGDGIWYLDTRTGAKESWVSVHPWKVERAPVVADLYGAGTTQWIVEVSPAVSWAGPAILVYDTHAPFDAKWPHVPYPNEPDGGSDPDPDPPPSGDFDASFSDVGGNEWWIQTSVSSSGGTLAKVDVRLNGGNWQPLDKKSYGWAASYHAPQGTEVQFRATSTGGATDLSGCYRWTDATPISCSDDGGGGGETGDFDASFSGVGGNEWWIQASVSASGGTLSKVDVRLNDGSWKPLNDEGWGWAASYHAPEGTKVQFRATSTGGATDLSGCYRWTDASTMSCGDSGGGGGGETGDFDASFSGVTGNEWWIQTGVSTSGGTLSKVDVRLNDGSWKPLDKKSYGWAASYHAPEGTKVQFRATSTGGATDLSGCYRWTGASTMSCGDSGGGGGSGDFDASFTPTDNRNEWWVEVTVKANEPLSAVHARVDGGSWQALDETDWGTWAKSIHAPSGSQVQFRATSTSGATDLSAQYTW